MSVKIETVEADSPAYLAGLRPGMALVSVDGHPIRDGLDYEFYTSGARLDIAAEDENGAPFAAVAVKDEYQPLGCGFATYLIDCQHHCKNKCVFCFVDQLPKGLRSPLYFKDDDERLGFLFGNYITLTNLGEEEVDRIIAMRISPVNISVHTVDPALRVQMMGNPRAGEALGIMPRLAKAGIAMNCQLVLCPGVNDGPQLARSIEWLAALAPAVQSVCAVPVGLTRYREGLAPLAAYTAETAAVQLDIMLRAGDELKARTGTRLVYPSDEWFLMTGREMPQEDFYEGYPQLENGVGMWRLMQCEFTDALEAAAMDEGLLAALAEGIGAGIKPEADLVVGSLAAPLLRQLAGLLAKSIPGARLVVHEVVNDFFGNGVTVTGLLTGTDIIRQLGGRLETGRLLLPADTLRAEGDLMLDGTTPEALAGALGVQVEVVPTGGANLLAAVLNLDEDLDEDEDVC